MGFAYKTNIIIFETDDDVAYGYEYDGGDSDDVNIDAATSVESATLTSSAELHRFNLITIIKNIIIIILSYIFMILCKFYY